MWSRRPSMLVLLGSGILATFGAVMWRPSPSKADGLGSSLDLQRCQVLSGPIVMIPDPASKNLYPLDAVYYLDYRGGRLLAGVPSGATSVKDGIPAANAAEKLTTEFFERDLVADFQIAKGVEPQFLMTVARMSFANGGWAPLYVFETVTGQVAVYRVTPEMVGTKNRTKILLLERKSLAKSALPAVGP